MTKKTNMTAMVLILMFVCIGGLNKDSFASNMKSVTVNPPIVESRITPGQLATGAL